LYDQNRGEVGRAIAERDAAALELTASTRLAASQVNGAAEAARILTARAAAMASSADTGFLARAEQVRGITFGAYREGAVPLIQVLDAARAWNEARVTFHDLLFAQHQSILELAVASGIDARSVGKDIETQTVK
jgi:outer membrane protein TolC